MNKKPEIFVGNIYACASATGAVAFLLCYGMMSFMPACMVSLAVTFFPKAHVGEIRLEFAEDPDKSQTGAEDSRHERKYS